MTIIRRSPIYTLPLRQAIDRLFEDSFVRPESWLGPLQGGALPLDVFRSKDAVVVRAALPGVKPDDVDISIEGDTLTIRASYNEEQREAEGDYLFQELRRGSFDRSITLPGDLQADAATASFDNGLLTLTIPKREEAKPRKIKITAQ